MKILLTGATGFLGSKLLERLLADGNEIILLTRRSLQGTRIEHFADRVIVHNICETSLESLFANHSIETVIHCATNYGRNQDDLLEILEANLLLPLRILQAAAQHKVRCFINTDTILDKQVSSYAMAKSQFHDWLDTFQESLLCINVALEHFYGAGDDPSKFVSFIVSHLLCGSEHIDLTAGEQKRDFIHVNDVVEAFCAIIAGHAAERKGCLAYQVGTGNSVSIRYFVELAHKIAGAGSTKLNFGAIPYREHEVMETLVDTTALRRLGWQPAIKLLDGLQMMITEEKEMLDK